MIVSDSICRYLPIYLVSKNKMILKSISGLLLWLEVTRLKLLLHRSVDKSSCHFHSYSFSDFFVITSFLGSLWWNMIIPWNRSIVLYLWVSERRNFIANALELHLSCTNPSISSWQNSKQLDVINCKMTHCFQGAHPIAVAALVCQPPYPRNQSLHIHAIICSVLSIKGNTKFKATQCV